jgi:hypothetical protein
VGHEVTALETREQFRDSLDALAPGLGTWFVEED